MSHIDQAAVTVTVPRSKSSLTDIHLRNIFSICGKITFCKGGRTGVIIFETHSAANTAFMFNGGKLGPYTYTITSEVEYTDHHDAGEHHFHIEQSDKPRAGIAAECLAKGYEPSDDILQRAIEIDNKRGISKKFLSFISDLNNSAGQSALGPDQTISGKVQSTSKEAYPRTKSIDAYYYVNALASPLGQTVLSFYASTSKQVRDIHEEATRIKEYMAMPTPNFAPASASK